jgi:sortase (surface protein transpeptidase)
VAIEIPSIGVTSSHFVDLGIAGDGTITVPGTADEVGFYTGGPSPGQLGPAVLAAHVDSTKGPGIFYRLGAVKVGDTVRVSRADGSTTTFAVDKVASYPKDQFPTEEVYRGGFDQSEIRLVTCGGTFDKVKHYLDNVVVFGHLTGVA